MMDLAFKAVHLIAVMTWVGGMVVSSLALFSTAAPRQPASSMLTIVRAWDRRVTSPAMLIVWALGITLAVRGGWFPDTWLVIKLVFVVALSGLHGVQAAMLRRAFAGQPPAGTRRIIAVLPAVAVPAIVCLAVMKPF